MANFPIPADDHMKKVIMDCVREVSAAKTQIEAHRDLIKEAIKKLSEDTLIPKKMLNKFASDYHRSTLATSIGQNEEYEALARALQPKAVGDADQEDFDEE